MHLPPIVDIIFSQFGKFAPILRIDLVARIHIIGIHPLGERAPVLDKLGKILAVQIIIVHVFDKLGVGSEKAFFIPGTFRIRICLQLFERRPCVFRYPFERIGIAPDFFCRHAHFPLCRPRRAVHRFVGYISARFQKRDLILFQPRLRQRTFRRGYDIPFRRIADVRERILRKTVGQKIIRRAVCAFTEVSRLAYFAQHFGIKLFRILLDNFLPLPVCMQREVAVLLIERGKPRQHFLSVPVQRHKIRIRQRVGLPQILAHVSVKQIPAEIVRIVGMLRLIPFIERTRLFADGCGIVLIFRTGIFRNGILVVILDKHAHLGRVADVVRNTVPVIVVQPLDDPTVVLHEFLHVLFGQEIVLPAFKIIRNRFIEPLSVRKFILRVFFKGCILVQNAVSGTLI